MSTGFKIDRKARTKMERRKPAPPASLEHASPSPLPDREIASSAPIGRLEGPQLNYEIPDHVVRPVSWEAEVNRLQELQGHKLEHDRSQDYARVKIQTDSPIGIVITGDWHLGSLGTDYEAWKTHMRMIREEPNAFMVTMSNTIDNFVFPSGMFHQMINPSEQMEIVKGFAHDFGPKLVAVVGSRCHEGWTTDKTDVNPNYLMFQENIEKGTPFLSKGGVVDVEVNGIKYAFGLMHKARGHSSTNPTNANRMQHDTRWPVDVLAAAHHHTASVTHGTKYEGPYQKEVVYVRSGAYKVDDAYSELEGYGKGEVASPMVVLDHEKKHMQVFYHLEDGIKYLGALRELNAIKNGGRRKRPAKQ